MSKSTGFHDMAKRDFTLNYENGNTYTPPRQRSITDSQRLRKAMMDAREEKIEARRLADALGEL